MADFALTSSAPGAGWFELTSGKHKGKTLPQVMFTDPDWFFDACDKRLFSKWNIEPLLADARLILPRSQAIRPRGKGSLVVDYYLHVSNAKFDRFEVVPASQAVHQGSSRVIRKEAIDLAVPFKYARYDKLGYGNFLRDLRRHLYGGTTARVTKARAESFFADPTNFFLSSD